LPLFTKTAFCAFFPAYFTIVLLLLPDPFPFYGTDTKDPVRSFFVHAAFLQDYLGADLAGHLWSLGVEVKFYLLAPLIALAFWKFGVRPGVAFFLLVWAGCVAGRWWDAVSLNVTDYPSYLTHIRTPFHHSVDGFVAGALSCLLYRSEWGQRHILSNRLRSNLLGLVGWGGFLLFMLSADQVGNLSVLHQAGMPFYLATCFGLILVSLLGQGWGKKLWGHAALYPLAILSYPLYLTHWLCLALAFALAAAGTFPVWGFSFWTIYVGSALISSLILHLAVERPFLARYRH
jgi:peptidoglycan/LPS O-acetylase OafA/YrhL